MISYSAQTRQPSNVHKRPLECFDSALTYEQILNKKTLLSARIFARTASFFFSSEHFLK